MFCMGWLRAGGGVRTKFFRFLKIFVFFRNLGQLVIMTDANSYCLERLDREEPTLGRISFIKRCILAMNRIPIASSEIYRFTYSF
jgi:hypothetical protein